MTTRTRCLATVAICASALGALLTASGAATAAAKTPSINGIWLAYSWFTGPASKTPNQVFVLRNNPGSTRVTGEWQGEFTIVGTFSPTTGEATLVAGVQPGVTQTTDFHVDFKFKSASTAPTNHPTLPARQRGVIAETSTFAFGLPGRFTTAAPATLAVAGSVVLPRGRPRTPRAAQAPFPGDRPSFSYLVSGGATSSPGP